MMTAIGIDSMLGRAEEMGDAHRDIAGLFEVLDRQASGTPAAGRRAA